MVTSSVTGSRIVNNRLKQGGLKVTTSVKQKSNIMSTTADLAKAMKSTLDTNGDLTKVRAQLEEEILEMTTQSTSAESNCTAKTSKPAMPPEIILANNLVRQYLEYVGLHKTSSALCTESGLPEKSVPENVLRTVFPDVHRAGEKPLLWCIVNNILTSSN